MDSIDFENVKAEKWKASRSISFLFRAAEICAALLFVCWIFTCLPLAHFLCRLLSLVSTPLFMFILGNSIVVTLLTTKSTVFSAARTTTVDAGLDTDIYEAFIRSGENRVTSSDGDLSEEIVDKKIIAVTDSTVARDDHVPIVTDKDSYPVTDSPEDPPTTKLYRRSTSEISEIVTKPPLLRRSETEKCRQAVESCEEVPFPEDNLTNEEFQKTVEAFIAKQLIFRRRESLAVVIHNQT